MNQQYQFHYETEANASFLVAVFDERASLVNYQMKMIENNQILHLLPARKYRQNENVKICYNVTSRLSLAQVLERQKMSKKEFLTFLKGLIECCRELPEYQLAGKGLLLDENYIFVKTGSFEPSFIYLPISAEGDSVEEIKRFVQKLILESRIASTNDNFVQVLLDLFNRENLTLEQLREGLKTLAQEGKPRAERPKAVEQPKPPVFQEVKVEPKPVLPEEKPSVPLREPPKTKHTKAKKEKPAKGTGSSKQPLWKTLVFAAVQVAALAVLAAGNQSGFFLTETGDFNISYLFGALIALAGIDVVVYRELFVNHNTAPAEKRKPGKNQKKPAGKAEKRPAAPVRPKPAAESASVPAAAPASAPSPVRVNRIPAAAPAPAQPYTPPMRPAEEPEDNSTVVLDENAIGSAHLEFYDNGLQMRIHLDNEVTRVGSRAQSVDYALKSNKVSKVHAEFLNIDGRYYVRDLNSTNGTFLNDSRERIVSNQDRELHNGDRVRLANIELVFKC